MGLAVSITNDTQHDVVVDIQLRGLRTSIGKKVLQAGACWTKKDFLSASCPYNARIKNIEAPHDTWVASIRAPSLKKKTIGYRLSELTIDKNRIIPKQKKGENNKMKRNSDKFKSETKSETKSDLSMKSTVISRNSDDSRSPSISIGNVHATDDEEPSISTQTTHTDKHVLTPTTPDVDNRKDEAKGNDAESIALPKILPTQTRCATDVSNLDRIAPVEVEGERIVLGAVYLEPDPEYFVVDTKLPRVVVRIQKEKEALEKMPDMSVPKQIQLIREKFEKEVKALQPLLIDKKTKLKPRMTVVPQRTTLGSDVLMYVPAGAWPFGAQLRIATTEDQRKRVTAIRDSHMFVSKRYRGAQDYYCYCMTQYQLLQKHQIRQVALQQRMWAMTLQDYFECSEEFMNTNQLGDQDVYAPYSIVLLSSHPLHDSILGFLRAHFSNPNSVIHPPAVENVWKLLSRIVLPKPGFPLKLPGVTKPSLIMSDERVDPPLLDMNLRFLLRRLDSALVIKILNQLSIEDSLLIVSSNMNTLTYSVECLRNLLFPVCWQFSTYSTYLAPEFCRNVLQSLQPFFFGCLKSHFYEYVEEEVMHQYDLLVVDVDQNVFTMVHKDTPILSAVKDALWLPGAAAKMPNCAPFPEALTSDLSNVFNPYCNRSRTRYKETSGHKSRRLNRLIKRMRSRNYGVEVRTRTYYTGTYPDCFVGNQAVNWVEKQENVSRGVALQICRRIFDHGHITHCLGDHPFLDEKKFYRWVPWQLVNLYQCMLEPGSGLQLSNDPDIRGGYPFYFTGEALVSWMVKEGTARSREEAVQNGQLLESDWLIVANGGSKRVFSDSKTRYHISSDLLLKRVPVGSVDADLLLRCRDRFRRGSSPILRSNKRPKQNIIEKRKRDIAKRDVQVFSSDSVEGIERAEYGWFSTSSQSKKMKYLVDVTDVLRDLQRGGWLVMPKGTVLQSLFHIDPCSGWPKHLRITYRLDKEVKQVTIADPINSDERIQVGTGDHWLGGSNVLSKNFSKIQLTRMASNPLKPTPNSLPRSRPPRLSVPALSAPSAPPSSKGKPGMSAASAPSVKELVLEEEGYQIVSHPTRRERTSAVLPNEDSNKPLSYRPPPNLHFQPSDTFTSPKHDEKLHTVKGLPETKPEDSKKDGGNHGKGEEKSSLRIRMGVARAFLSILNGFEYFSAAPKPSRLSSLGDIDGDKERKIFDRQRFLMSRDPVHRLFLKQFCQTQAFNDFFKNGCSSWAKNICKKFHPLPKAKEIYYTVTDRESLTDELRNIESSGPFLQVNIRGITGLRRRGKWGLVVSMLERGSSTPVEIGRTELQRWPPVRTEAPLTLRNVSHKELERDEQSVTRILTLAPNGPKAELQLDGLITFVALRKSLSSVVPTKSKNSNNLGNYGFQSNTLWVDSGCKAVFCVTSLLSSPPNADQDVKFDLNWKQREFTQCIMRRVPQKQYPILQIKLINEKNPNNFLAESEFNLRMVSKERNSKLEGHWLILTPRVKSFPAAPMVMLDMEFVPGGIDDRVKGAEGYQEELHVGGINVRQNAVMPLGDRRVSLKSHHISNHELEYVAWALASPCAVRALDLRDNSFDLSGLKVLFLALKKSTTMLTALDLGENTLTTFVSSAEFKKALTQNTSLTCLKMERTGLDDKCAENLASVLTINQSLVWLELSENSIGPAGAKSLARGLRAFESKLATLNLRGNMIGCKGVESLCKALVSNTALKSLNLRKTGFGAAGALSLAIMLQKNKGIRSLNIARNNFGFKYCGDVKPIAEISSSLVGNSTLTSINMSYCSFNSNEMKILADGIKKNNIIRHLAIHQDASESKRHCESLQISIHDNLFKHLDSLRQNLKMALSKKLETMRYVFCKDYFWTVGETYVQATKCEPARALYKEGYTKVVVSWASGPFIFKLDPNQLPSTSEGRAIYLHARLQGIANEAGSIREMARNIKQDLRALAGDFRTSVVRITSKVAQAQAMACCVVSPTRMQSGPSTPSVESNASFFGETV